MRGTAHLVAAFLILAGQARGGPTPPPSVDGLMGDWGGARPLCVDREGDGAGIDFGRVWVRSDSERITMRLEVGTEINLQNGNAITLLIDGDANPATGNAAQGLGVELAWTFGERSGTIWHEGRAIRVEQAAIGLRQAPTVSSREFEISIRRRAEDKTRIMPGPYLSIVILDEGSAGADRLPDEGGLTVALSETPPPPPLPVSLERWDPDDIRLLTWNVLFDGLFERPAPFVRVLRAIDPDVICFQEIWTHTARQAADQVSLALPDATWYGVHLAEGHIVSRYPFLDARPIDEAGNYWALIDLPDERYDTDLCVICAHPPCCDKEEERQRELDGIAAWIRDLVTPGGIDLAPGTPIVVAGDMNLVGGAQQVQTLLAGEIADEATFGTSHRPDWDGTAFAASNPRHAGGRDIFTWRDPRSSFAPGKLDYIVYSDSVLKLGNAFTLATEELAPDVLERYGLHPRDTLEASDHLPVVADFTPTVSRARTERAE